MTPNMGSGSAPYGIDMCFIIWFFLTIMIICNTCSTAVVLSNILLRSISQTIIREKIRRHHSTPVWFCDIENCQNKNTLNPIPKMRYHVCAMKCVEIVITGGNGYCDIIQCSSSAQVFSSLAYDIWWLKEYLIIDFELKNKIIKARFVRLYSISVHVNYKRFQSIVQCMRTWLSTWCTWHVPHVHYTEADTQARLKIRNLSVNNDSSCRRYRSSSTNHSALPN